VVQCSGDLRLVWGLLAYSCSSYFPTAVSFELYHELATGQSRLASRSKTK
jgi:hypothetical protein